MNSHHHHILNLIIQHSGNATQHTFSDNYLGNTNPRYPINVPTLRKIAKVWMSANEDLTAKQFTSVITSMVTGKSSTEKYMAGILLNYAKPSQRKFDLKIFNLWLDHLTGWAEVDSLCTGDFSLTEIKSNWSTWKKLLIALSKSDNINKRRASLVLLCSPLQGMKDERMADLAFTNVNQLKSEKDILITKAISWVLRSMNKHHQTLLKAFVQENEDSLPKIATREVLLKIKTGTKTKRKAKSK